MRTIVVTGALGQIGTELVPYLRERYGAEQVIATDVKAAPDAEEAGPYAALDVMDGEAFYEVVQKHRADTIIHLAALLSATAEAKPLFAWQLNMGGLLNALETARQLGCSVFTPSSIAAFGAGVPKLGTPQDAPQRPSTLYGISKVSGELLCDYYYLKYGVDTRGLRLPGLISYAAAPGGGTTDYAVDMYRQAVSSGSYTSYIAEGTYMDMMYMPDALESIVRLMEADPAKLAHRNAYNVSAMSIEPGMIGAAIRKQLPDFRLDYCVDPVRQAIAESWPDALDVSAAEEEWGFRPQYDLGAMTADMLRELRLRLPQVPPVKAG
ncbi:UDP-glucose 4-epimerase [Gordoniibacillus kamchatkensis]|uniref:UDP-glucose 4-epimerase n=1 Tax=Gordoniibacillus kamchatkensis TaxID=1590651 RepID=A0ABR5AKD5_9BACL|nr:NAD-dependent epimerase/dehydratase family protein [Paenibacillus sp. VKM B-2647]KIL41420.1 UDP-glucose 4-epimerase [Paenibacillus sp. VKM B-2647]